MTPDQHTNQELFLDVGDGHQLYVQDWGNPKINVPIIFLHGGPGSGTSDRHRQRFDPMQQRVIFFDQRGSGKSLPKGSLENNTTADAVEDIEKVAKHFKLNKFFLSGGSWGSTLALSYALAYPKRVEAMVLSGIFTGRQSEIDYLDNGGFKTFFPDIWEKYVGSVPKSAQADPSAYYHKQVMGSDAEDSKRAAYAYSEMLEGPLLSLDDRYTPTKYEDFDPDAMRIELHFLQNRCFLPEGSILKQASKLTMPIWLVQGRYDMVCPPTTAYELSKLLPNGHLIWTTAGHGNDRPTYDVIRTLFLQLTAGHNG